MCSQSAQKQRHGLIRRRREIFAKILEAVVRSDEQPLRGSGRQGGIVQEPQDEARSGYDCKHTFEVRSLNLSK